MKAFQRTILCLFAGIVVVVSGGLVYLFITGDPSSQQMTSTRAQPHGGTRTAVVAFATNSATTVSNPAKPCSSKQRSFQMGVAFPDWGTTAYGVSDTNWLEELPGMQAATAACWVEMPVLLHQSTLTSTTVDQGPATAQLTSFDYGVRLAHALGLHVFVTMQLQTDATQHWSGAINFSTDAQEQQWFESYWQAIKPYAVTAARDKVEQFALGTEFAWLEQNAPATLWNVLIDEASAVFPGTLTYDMNWGSLQTPPPSWMRNTHLKMIGISAYSPLTSTPQRVDPKLISNLWKQTVKPQLDNFSMALGEPIFLSEVGFPDREDALYRPWQSTSTAPLDPAEQAAASGAVLANILSDQRILGTFFWGWDNTADFNLKGVQAASEIQSYYKALQA